jgi:hypothetical protein
MKKQLLIAAVAATMTSAAFADVSITGDAKFEYFNAETAGVSTNKTNTETNISVKGQNGDTAVVINVEVNGHGDDQIDIEDMYMTTKIGDVTIKGGDYASGTSGILGEIDNGGRANDKVTISGTNGGVSWYAGNSGTAGGATAIDNNGFYGASVDVAGWKVQAKHNSATVDSFGISGDLSGLGVRLEQKSSDTANSDVTFGNMTYSTNGINLGYAFIDADQAGLVTEDDSSIFAVEMATAASVGLTHATGVTQVSANTSIAGNSVTVKSGSVEKGINATTDLDFMQIAASRPLASGATLAVTYTDKDASATTDTKTLELDLSVKF